MPEDPRGFVFEDDAPEVDSAHESEDLARIWQRLIDQEQWPETAESE